MKTMLLAFFLHLCSIGVCAQDTIDMVAKLGIQDDIAKLESLVVRKMKKYDLSDDYRNYRLIHVFKLKICCDEKEITKKDWLDYSFLNYLKPEYVWIKEKRFGFRKKYLYTYTFLVNPKGYISDVFIGGRFYLCASDVPKDLLSNDNNIFIFMSGWLPSLHESKRDEYVVVKNNKLYGFKDYSDCSDCKTLIPWDTYISRKF